ncbi:MAG: hypoxanthine phosphoribosyltransferase [Planctomycetota bacterium]
MTQIPVLLTKTQIKRRVKQLAGRLNRDYCHKELVLIGILKGSFIFMADLFRHLTIPVQCDFVSLSSYGPRTTSSGKIKIRSNFTAPIKNKDILIIEDIIDSGLTVSYLKKELQKYHPKDVKICTLLDKPARRKIKLKLAYVGFKIPDRFVVGYGIDYNEHYRSLPYIGYIRQNR